MKEESRNIFQFLRIRINFYGVLFLIGLTRDEFLGNNFLRNNH